MKTMAKTTTAPEYKPSECQCDCQSKKARSSTTNDAPGFLDTTLDPPTTPIKNDDDISQLTPRSDGSLSSRDTASSKRRRLISFDSKTGEELLNDPSARKLNYESTLPSDVSEGSVDDIGNYKYEVARRKTVKKLWEVNYGDEDDRLVQTCSRCKLYEFVTYYDAVKGETLSRPPWLLSDEEKEELQRNGKWKYRGTGQVKFIQTLEEGYNCGMIRMEMIHDGTLNTLMCHELLDESVSMSISVVDVLIMHCSHYTFVLQCCLQIMPMASKKGKSFTWKCKDWAYRTMKRTFAIRFEDELEAVKWKNLVENSKTNNKNIRRGIDVPECKEVDELSTVLKRMCTM